MRIRSGADATDSRGASDWLYVVIEVRLEPLEDNQSRYQCCYRTERRHLDHLKRRKVPEYERVAIQFDNSGHRVQQVPMEPLVRHKGQRIDARRQVEEGLHRRRQYMFDIAVEDI